ncbi:flavin reductase family protein [Lapillicoccus jejuensis]|uniref:Flavin reductase (DIM6/NTAB) family NADH-FMN oxidoreductase RutF n=1 Tax=Lapillicoccus jejuensis TaxID=402171 RepID=A0A542E4S9_9MICO|nr:flavin reductase family protein [Lapillicoccus jejuensis]TQJ10327.1 flavin reductase (DIM6/NTAB) family NADH-FMN oxidoreductase RutF [Lapillicoccus jejuensis]
MSSVHFYRPSQGHGLPHDPFNAIVAPRPIGWISTVAPDGTRNLAPYSFFNAFAYTPPIVGFSSTEEKDSARNARETGEFTWSLVTRPLAERMNETSTTEGVDEWERAGLQPAPSRVVAPPRVADSPVGFECRVSQILPLTGADGTPNGAVLTLGEVVGVHIDEDYLQDGIYQTAKAQPVMRAGGPSAYYGISEDLRFDLRRPR